MGGRTAFCENGLRLLERVSAPPARNNKGLLPRNKAFDNVCPLDGVPRAQYKEWARVKFRINMERLQILVWFGFRLPTGNV